MTDWFRSWHGAPTDPKWLGIARRAGVAPGIAAAVGWALMDRASQASDRGNIEGYDADGLACFFGCEPEQVDAIVAAMTAKTMLIDGRFSSWERRQPKREDDSAQRVREHRERKKKDTKRDVTQENAPDTDTEEERKDEANASLSLYDDKKVRLMVDIYHQYGSPKFPKVYKITGARRSAALRRWKDCGGEDGWRELMIRAAASQHLTGNNNRGWTADFDFFLQEKSFTRLREGFYDARTPSSQFNAGKPTTGHAALIAAARRRVAPSDDGGGGLPGLSDGFDAERDGSGVYRFADRSH